ncbi:MAG: hypothetical protein HC802_06310 [Caldilineaceae bacterium]|nr:hypothetical protein [Caldilineaceae bacterium]
MYTIRPFDPEQDGYAALVEVYNLDWPDDPDVPETWIHNDNTRDMRYLMHRFVAEADGAIVAEGVIYESDWSYVPGKYSYHYNVRPPHASTEQGGQHVHDAILDYVLEFVAPRDPAPVKLTTHTRENRSEKSHSWRPTALH